MNNNLKAVLQNLKSDKIKERQEGLSSLRTVFAQDAVVASFHVVTEGIGDPRTWLPVFQALFQVVLNEKLLATKKTTGKSMGSVATAERRLADAASAVRWLTERAVHVLNKRVIRALYEHLLQTMVHKKKLLVPVALDYIKALRCLVTFTPHLDYMENETWIKIVEMGFNMILGDPIGASFNEDVGIQSPLDVEADGSDLYLEDDLMGDAGDIGDHIPSTSRKRGRRDSITRQAQVLPRYTLHNSRQQSTVSLEQVEFMAILVTLLGSSSSPILSPGYTYLPSSILRRLQRFLVQYPADTSLVHDYVMAVSATLSHLALNRTHDVIQFSRTSWDNLVGLWGTKNKRVKEGLVAILRVLYPYVTADNEVYSSIGTRFDCAEGVGKLWHVLGREAESRWGVDGLLLDSLRLEINDHQIGNSDNGSAFVARTFQSGIDFDQGQALAWAILELQADCAGKLFQLSEFMHSASTPGSSRGEGKRIRLENPIQSLLFSIQHQPAVNIRVYHLQVLLFFVDRHWSIVHNALQQVVIQTLLQSVSHDDGIIQSWAFLCLTAIIYANTSKPGLPLSGAPEHSRQPHSSYSLQSNHDETTWDLIWTNAVRRANVPAACRAACHAAYALLLHSRCHPGDTNRATLPSQRILLEIETLGKDLDVQGPAYPYDSVCAFLVECLKVSSQDMRLYRLQLEEKVLSWLVDCWKVVDLNKTRMSLYMVKDIILLLEHICGLPKHSDLAYRIPLPQCQIVETLVEEGKTKVIRDFLLDARLSGFQRNTEAGKTSSVLSPESKTVGTYHTPANNEIYLAPPRGRERKISAFLLKSLERLIFDWEVQNGHPTAEVARRSLDMAVTALSFEAVLFLNGTQLDRRVLQSGCKVIRIVTAILTDVRWTAAEKALISLGLDPLTYTGQGRDNDKPWEVMLPPDIGTGIKTHSLNLLNPGGPSKAEISCASRMDFLRMIWQNSDVWVQDAFDHVSTTMREILRVTLQARAVPAHNPSLDGDEDDFAPIRAVTTQGSSEASKETEDTHSSRYTLESCVSFLVTGGTLQSASGEPARDRDLTELILKCKEPDIFILVCPILLEKIRRGVLDLSLKHLDNLLDKLSGLLKLYAYARSKTLQSLAIQLLDATLDIWALQQVHGEIIEKIQDLCGWLSRALKGIRDWMVRDLLARFFDRFLSKDPRQNTWRDWNKRSQVTGGEGQEYLPDALLSMMGSDNDIRVRFRVAVINARLFKVARALKEPALDVYNTIRRWYTVDLDNYEHMLTRMLSLGNIMVTSSAVRRGPYWHLLETCIHSPLYSHHIESILREVSYRMGLPRFSMLFESYASQLAYSIRKANSDFLVFPPHLLGYRDRKECAENIFRSFTPTNIWNGGQRLFEGHCKIIQKSISTGLHECFGDILGYQIVSWVDGHEMPITAMESLLQDNTFHGEEFEEALSQNLDGIIASILRTLGDQDFSGEGPIVKALENVDRAATSVKAFKALTRYRRIEHFDSHNPNLPIFPTETVLQALDWLRYRLPNANEKATTYHVLHQLFADIEQSPMVNEQIRLINAVSLWIASHCSSFDDATLLYTLIHGATSLLEQLDLAKSSQSLLEWSFGCYRKTKHKDPRFPNVLIRISCIAHDYAIHNDPQMSTLGKELQEWVDNQALKLSEVAELRSQVLRALPAWSHEGSSSLAELYGDVTANSLSTVLNDNRISSKKFRLVRRLHELGMTNGLDKGSFSKSDFWHLKECMPQVEHLHESDVIAFVSLLFLNKGKVDSFGSELSNSTSIISRHRRNLQKSKMSSGTAINTAQEFIVLTLLAMLEGDKASQVHVAYQALRLIKSTPVANTVQLNLWPPEYQTELHYLETYRRSPKTRPPRDLHELLTSDSYSHSTRDFPVWIAQFSILLTDILSEQDPFYAQLASILQHNSVFADSVLPVLVHTLLQAEKANIINTDSPCRTLLSQYFTSILSSNFTSVSCLRSIVEVILHLRHSSYDDSDALSYNKWLDVNFTLLAQNAITCGAYTTALLFLELAAESNTGENVDNTSTEEILYSIYRHIDEPDGFYGISDGDLHQFLMKRFQHEKQWEKAFRFHGAALEAGGSQAKDAEGLINSFHSFGFDHLAIDALQRSSLSKESISSSPAMGYRLGWRTETWDLPDRDEESPGASLYFSLRAVHRERDKRAVDNIIQRSLVREMSRLQLLGPENIAQIRDVVRDLMCLREVMQWRGDSNRSRLTSADSSTIKWGALAEIDGDFEFSSLEAIMATRISLVRSAKQREQRQQIGNISSQSTQNLIDLEKRCLVRLSEAARNAGQAQIALNSIVRAQLLEKSPSFLVFQEFANVLWCQKEEQAAVQYLSRIATDQNLGSSRQHIKDTISDVQRATLLARLGSWSSEACMKKPTDIRDQYFNKAAASLPDTPCFDDAHAVVYHECAMFAERQYQAFRNSPDTNRWKVYRDRKEFEIQSLQGEIARAKDEKEAEPFMKAQLRAKKLLQKDNELFGEYSRAQDTFLKQAIDMYARCLQSSNTFDGDAAIRLCSLWFANFEVESLQSVVEIALDRIPSHKFVFLAHQLSARISASPAGQCPDHQRNLQNLIVRMCSEHPFHSLYQVYSLKGLASSSSTRRQSGRHLASPTQTEREAAAESIFDRLRNDPNCGERVMHVELLSRACLDWARCPVKSLPNKKVPGTFLLLKISKLKVPVMTYHTPLDPTMKYDNCAWLDRYEGSYETAGGVNQPKISLCYDTAGQKHKQLFKGGGDDLRQDAVMEQVFELVNGILSRDRETRRRDLNIRDYKVIPLGSQAGVLEFVGNTLPLGEWLIKAHVRYHPKDISHNRAFAELKKARVELEAFKRDMEKGKLPHGSQAPKDLVTAFREVKKRFHPVMRHYFTERHKTPISWFAMRLRYSRSVATTSIIGHILGLGDRHVSNILLDNASGQVVHIDLGIAFDQGKLLPVPELVPFRMTRDMVDGMGTSGTNGVFQRCAEETLRVMREDSEVIMTVLEVFNHDPLHSWTASEIKLKHAQTDKGTDRSDIVSGVEEAADRALSSVARKLDKALSVQYTVNQLITDATHEDNLAQIYYGWSPHC